MQITITPQEVEKYEDFEQQIQDYPLYGHTSGLTRVDIVILGKLLQYEFPNELIKPITITIK